MIPLKIFIDQDNNIHMSSSSTVEKLIISFFGDYLTIEGFFKTTADAIALAESLIEREDKFGNKS